MAGYIENNPYYGLDRDKFPQEVDDIVKSIAYGRMRKMRPYLSDTEFDRTF